LCVIGIAAAAVCMTLSRYQPKH
jgi:hypothetical protein